MIAIHLGKELEEQIDLLAKVKQSNRSAVVREAVIRYLEDNDDRLVVLALAVGHRS